MTANHETTVRISATVRRSTRDKMRYLADQRTRAGRPTSESHLWSEAGALYLRLQADLPGSQEHTSKKVTERLDQQTAELSALRAELDKANAEVLAQRRYLVELRKALQPILDRLAPPAGRGG